MTPTAPAPRRRNLPGLIAFVLAVILTISQIVQVCLTTIVPVLAYRGGLDATEIGAVFIVIGIAQLILAALTTILGVAGVARRGVPKTLAAIALGAGANGVIVQLSALILPPLIGVGLS
ncbi:hypothetical protein [Rathayibacter sp. SD072]|uniref:hypothetical protein n=1 Tax=Rathayibacter sp. SD072 TaxID=2781731 RepID=UPI001A96C7A4|nr:hypothetical protein [Rathayibacter sp. SD072]MBO0984672.1 hypothetical protein [Rathayibacter sp. SD072]